MAHNETYIIAHHILTPLGNGIAANWQAISESRSGVALQYRDGFRDQPVCASLFSESQWAGMGDSLPAALTQFEQLLLSAVQGALGQVNIDLSGSRTLLLLASTKGNIGLLAPGMPNPQDHVGLVQSARKIAGYLNYHSHPVVVSNACISGMTALLTAKRLMDAGHYDHAVVAGADCISPFIVAGFRSFQALSDETCRPFDIDRKGINLGEGAAAIILSRTASSIRLSAGSTSSDANHISGPSRTGEEMAQAIMTALERAGLGCRDIGGISAHGTATSFNDEMESKAFMLSGLEHSPVFSLKAYFGHTLGAAGLLESAIAVEALQKGIIPASKGYRKHGVSQPVTIAETTILAPGMRHILKTGSGFGGCNAALVFSKNN